MAKYTVFDSQNDTKLLETVKLFEAERLCIHNVRLLDPKKECYYLEKGMTRHYYNNKAHYIIVEEED